MMLLSGRLSDWSVEDLLQMLHITKKTASLHVDGDERSGVVYVDEGAIVGADVTVGGGGAVGREAVVEAIYVLLLLEDGDFEMRNEVSPNEIDPLAVAEALELASEHVAAERSLDETGLLNARGLRLAQEIDEPIILSEEVWAAISVSIPAFTFSELERRMGRAGAVETLEQFRDLGVLEAVLDEPVEPSTVPFESQQPETVVDEPAPPVASDVAPVDEVEVEESEVAFAVDDDEPAPLMPLHEDAVDEIVPADEDDSWIEPRHDVAPTWMADEADVAEPSYRDEHDDIDVVETPASGGSLSDAIRAAAAAAAPAAPEPVRPDDSTDGDDESTLLSEAAGDDVADDDLVDADVTGSAVGSSLRRSVRALVDQSDATLVQGVLDDLGSRFRQQSGD